MHRGFVTLHRRIVDWEWYSDINVFRVFTHLILTANWEPKKWRGKLIKRGQRIISLSKIAEETGLTEQQARTALSKLKLTSEITTTTTNKYTLVTLTNYDFYQSKENQITRKITNEKQSNNNQTTIKQHSDNNQITTTKQLEQLQPLETTKNNSIIENSNEAHPNVEISEKRETEIPAGKIGKMNDYNEWAKAIGKLQLSQQDLTIISLLKKRDCKPIDAEKARLECKQYWGKLANENIQQKIIIQKDLRFDKSGILPNGVPKWKQQLRDEGFNV